MWPAIVARSAPARPRAARGGIGGGQCAIRCTKRTPPPGGDDQACRGRRGRVAADRQPGHQRRPQGEPAHEGPGRGVDREARLRPVDRRAADERLAVLHHPRAQRPRSHDRRLDGAPGRRLGRSDAARRDAEMRRARLSDDDRAGRHPQRPCPARASRDHRRAAAGRRDPDSAAFRQCADHQTFWRITESRLRGSVRSRRGPESG